MKEDSQIISEYNLELKERYPHIPHFLVSRNVDTWSPKYFLNFFSFLFENTYRLPCLEIGNEKYMGRLILKLDRGLLKKFENYGCSKELVAMYIEWVFVVKGNNLPVSLGFLLSSRNQAEFLKTGGVMPQGFKRRVFKGEEDVCQKDYEFDPSTSECKLCRSFEICRANRGA